jgi:RNA polymerase sigma-70 factor (ECF subfamily)
MFMADEEIVKRDLEGGSGLFEIIMRRYIQRLYRTARAIPGGDGDAEQVMEEAYFPAYTHLNQFAGKAKSSTWLRKIAVYEAPGRVRRGRRFADIIRRIEASKLKIRDWFPPISNL